jgi:Amt family ammonium transporter
VSDILLVTAQGGRRPAIGQGALSLLAPLAVLDSPWVLFSLVAALFGLLIAWRFQLARRFGRSLWSREGSLFETHAHAIARLDGECRIQQANSAFCSLTGYSPEQVDGQRFDELFKPTQRPRVVSLLARAQGGASRSIETKIHLKDRRTAEVELTCVPIVVREQGIGLYAIVKDITDRKNLERELENRALHDYLTGLPNRALFTDRLEHALLRASRAGRRIAMIYIDLDRFKPVNDRAGHAAGDELLREIASRLRTVVRQGDTVARLGGDEFAVLLESMRTEAEATNTAARIVNLIRKPCFVAGSEFQVGASAGVAISNEETEDPEDLVRQADMAMYEAKRSGGFQYQQYSRKLVEAKSEAAVDLEIELKRAIKEDELHLQYQPIVDIDRTRVVGFEALVRWEHPELGVLLPSHFVPLAEKSSLIAELDRWVLARGLRDMSRLVESGEILKPFHLSVNLSARHCEEPDFVDAVSSILLESGFDPDYLQLELTESAAGKDMQKVRRLKALGVKLAIDDFGTGYSSLGYLKDLDVDVLKVDKSFIVALGADPASVAIVRTILTLAEMLDLEVIVEGIEDEVQLEHLKELGGAMVQGFYFGRPSDFVHLPRILRERPGPKQRSRAETLGPLEAVESEDRVGIAAVRPYFAV